MRVGENERECVCVYERERAREGGRDEKTETNKSRLQSPTIRTIRIALLQL